MRSRQFANLDDRKERQDDENEQQWLRSISNETKDDKLRVGGFDLLSYPISRPCRVCEYGRRLINDPQVCLFCGAFN